MSSCLGPINATNDVLGKTCVTAFSCALSCFCSFLLKLVLGVREQFDTREEKGEERREGRGERGERGERDQSREETRDDKRR